tara:strand:+ start:4909 stop:5877 length:969 start_codon:yes stop_codon:yes gene_type:complete
MFNGVSHQIKNIFNRPVVSTRNITSVRIENENTPDISSNMRYGNSDVFYVNTLINNITEKELWPKTQLEFSNTISTTYKGFAFHILETPSSNLQRGDIIILSSDIGQCDLGDVECYPTYGIIEEYDPALRKIWIKNYIIGTKTTATTESNFFKENNKFKIFKRKSNGVISDPDGVSITNSRFFDFDPNYTFEQRVFTMKKVTAYIDSADKFKYSVSNSEVNPLQQNMNANFDSSTNIFDTFVSEYNSGNTNGSCSLLDAYILEANGQTGPDKSNYILDYRFEPDVVINRLTLENENERYIYAANKSAIPTIIDDIERQLNDK